MAKIIKNRVIFPVWSRHVIVAVVEVVVVVVVVVAVVVVVVTIVVAVVIVIVVAVLVNTRKICRVLYCLMYYLYIVKLLGHTWIVFILYSLANINTKPKLSSSRYTIL